MIKVLSSMLLVRRVLVGGIAAVTLCGSLAAAERPRVGLFSAAVALAVRRILVSWKSSVKTGFPSIAWPAPAWADW